MTGKELNLVFKNQRLIPNRFPMSMGVTLDRMLTFKEHLTNLAAKIQTRNNILLKLCGSTCEHQLGACEYMHLV